MVLPWVNCLMGYIILGPLSLTSVSWFDDDDDDGEFVLLYSGFTHLRNGTGCRAAVLAAPLLITSGPVRCEASLHDCGSSLVCLFYAIATIFQYIMEVL